MSTNALHICQCQQQDFQISVGFSDYKQRRHLVISKLGDIGTPGDTSSTFLDDMKFT